MDNSGLFSGGLRNLIYVMALKKIKSGWNYKSIITVIMSVANVEIHFFQLFTDITGIWDIFSSSDIGIPEKDISTFASHNPFLFEPKK